MSQDFPNDNGRQRVIVAGFGPVGRVVADGLTRRGLHVTIIELNRRTVDRNDCETRPFVCGDVRVEQVLREAGIEQADALVLAIPDQEQVVQAVEIARRIAPRIYIAARTNHLSFGMRARSAGADHVTVEEVVTAEAMDRAVSQRLIGSGRREEH